MSDNEEDFDDDFAGVDLLAENIGAMLTMREFEDNASLMPKVTVDDNLQPVEGMKDPGADHEGLPDPGFDPVRHSVGGQFQRY